MKNDVPGAAGSDPKPMATPGRALSTPSVAGLHLGQLKKRAKELLAAHRSGDAEATARLHERVPRLTSLPVAQVAVARLALADAQHALAAERGFASWPKLVRAIELAVDRSGALLAAALAGDEGTLSRAAGLEPGVPLGDTLAADVRGSLALACALADVEAVRASGADVTKRVAPLDAPALAYACAARHGRGDPAVVARRVAIVQLLLERGADPETSYRDVSHFDGERVVLSAAALHVGAVALLRALVEGGATPIDHSALWHAADPALSVDEDRLEGLRYLLGFHRDRWRKDYALSTCVRTDSVEGVALLLEAGADPNTGGGWGGSGTLLHQVILGERDPRILDLLFAAGDRTRRDRERRTPLEVARLVGHADAITRLEALGDEAPTPDARERALIAACAGDDGAARREASDAPPLGLRRGDHLLLAWAIERDRTAAVRALLAIGADPNLAHQDGRTPLAMAQELGRHDAAALLVEAGARAKSHALELCPESEFETFERAADAVVDGDRETLGRLLDGEPELVLWRSRRGHHATLLHYLGSNGVETHRQRTPENVADMIALLVGRGAVVDALADTYGGGPAQTTLALAASSGHPADAGVQYELIRALCAAGAEANGVDDDGLPVATAIGFGQRESLRALVEAGARLDNVMFAAAAGDVGLVERMVGPDLELRPPHVDCTIDWFAGQSEPAWQLERAFVLAAGFGQAGVVRLLLERGVPIDCAPRGGETALHSAAFHGRLEVVELLLERGARADLRDGNYHGTPFGWAHEGKRRDVIERLAEHRTPDLFDAASCHLIRAVREHLERDPSLVDAPEGRGGLLLWAARSGSLALTELLLEFGAKRDVRDPKGKSPVELAEAGGHAEVAERLRST